MKNYAASRADRARRCNYAFRPEDVGELVGRPRLAAAGTFAGEVARAMIARFEVFMRGRVDIDVEAKPLTLGVDEAAARFVEWMRGMGLAGDYSDQELRAFMEWWMADEIVRPLPLQSLCTAIKRQLGVRCDRPRLKSSGGPERITRYRILDQVDPVVRQSQRGEPASRSHHERQREPLRLAA